MGRSPLRLAVGDLRGNGDSDLAVANNGDGTVTVLLSDGAGGFAEAPASPLGTTCGDSVAIREINGDGKQDIVCSGSKFEDTGLIAVFWVTARAPHLLS